MSDPVRPHRRQPTRLPRPWDSPGKNTGVGCHFLLRCMKVKSESEVAQSCPSPSDLMDCSPPGSSIHGIFQARVLECGAIAFSKVEQRSRQLSPFLSQVSLEGVSLCLKGISLLFALPSQECYRVGFKWLDSQRGSSKDKKTPELPIESYKVLQEHATMESCSPFTCSALTQFLC